MARRLGRWLLLFAALTAQTAGEATQGQGTDGHIETEWRQTRKEDSTWVLTSAFMILTMQSGFGALESGFVSQKFQVNVMMKNVIDVVFGGLSYWIFGYGMSYGTSWHGFAGTSDFLVNVVPEASERAVAMATHEVYSHYIFQFTFASTATTIVSGCVAGRMKFNTYIIFSFINVAIYGVACHWVWHSEGWLYRMGFHDFAGDGPVHLMGGATGLVAAWMIGPRHQRFEPEREHQFGMKNPMNCILGLFMLWWGWLGFNCGSTFGITGDKWLVAARVAVTTINSSIGGGVFGVAYSAFYVTPGVITVEHVVNSILAGLVAITAGCACVSPAEATMIGVVGAFLASVVNIGLAKYHLVDDPVGAVGVHGVAAFWGLIAVGLCADRFEGVQLTHLGLFYGGGWQPLAVQALGATTIMVWTVVTSAVSFKLLDKTMGLRAPLEQETQGFDEAEHQVQAEEGLAILQRDAPQLFIQVEVMTEQIAKMEVAMQSMREELQELRDEKKLYDGWCHGILVPQIATAVV